MTRMFAIIERELRKFFRSPTLMMVAMVFPLVQLIVLGVNPAGIASCMFAPAAFEGPLFVTTIVYVIEAPAV